MGNDPAFRFAVKNNRGLHSQQWRIQVNKNDCYIGSRWIAGHYKASFHESGECHIGFTYEFRNKKLSNSDEWKGPERFYDKWFLDIDLEKKSTVKLLELIIPHSQLDKFENKSERGLHWINCPKGMAASFLFLKANIEEKQYYKQTENNLKELCRLPLTNGNSIIILSRLIEEKKEYNELIKEKLQNIFPIRNLRKTYIEGEIDTNCKDIRAMIWHPINNEKIVFEGSLSNAFEC